MSTPVPRRVLPVIVLSQFAGTSLWFAVNAVLPDLQRNWALPATALATLTSSVQLGFVAGTLAFALLMLADRFRPTRVFLACSLLGALCNAVLVLVPPSFGLLVALRFAVGFLLAGIYPVGMKIAASWYREGLGAALGVLVGALVLGTALPHGLRALAADAGGAAAPWQLVILAVSLFAALGGIATAWLVPDQPRTVGTRVTPRALAAIWSEPRLRASVFGYFGHMWELYSFYALAPVIIAVRWQGTRVSALAFWAIGAGALGCIAGGLLARRLGSARIAQWQLATSGCCCLLAPVLLQAPAPLFVAWLLLWGTTVVGDSPQFSALTARNAPKEVVGSVLTFTNCLGFAISVASIELFVRAAAAWPLGAVLPWLALGPALGLLALRPLLRPLAAAPSG
ncbi:MULTISPECIES: MFS transporter [Ramlibacter]|uniref:MFS transporter n=1 Tax=Ramlibacter pinisoli TaxID=2682844 RepID=A0A6N8IP39_9BURK|nr:MULTISPECIES: MFS transporter [Ramlibacter]MBA2963515.1 MFS transporter [Ramlibacter sp. CGMCC 1.13660]MVQ28482.1 MFS transporter [Ramlibacter pinisoli]